MIKKNVVLIVLFLCFVMFFNNYLKSEENNIPIIKIKFCLGIENKKPISESLKFKNDVGKIYCWSLFEKVKEDMEIEHIWYYQNKIITKMKLNIKSPKYVTWSLKNISKSQKGNWKVVVVDKIGNVLTSACFIVE